MIHGRVPGIEKPVARIVQGTVMSSSDEEKGFALLDEIFEAGGATFDTVHQYGNGDSERASGRWARGRGLRDEVELTTEELAWLEGDEGWSGGGLAFSA